MFYRGRILAITLLFVALAAGCKPKPQGAGPPNAAPTGAKISLGFHPKVGERKLVITNGKQIITETRPGQGRQVINQESYAEMEWTISSTNDDGTTTARIRYQRFMTTGPAGKGDSNVNINITDRVYKAICSKAFEADFARTGEVKAVRGLSALYDAIGLALPEFSAPERDQIIEQAKTQFSEAVFTKSLQIAFYPSLPIDNGDLWYNTTRVENLGTEVASKYMLLEHDATTASISLASNLSTNPKTPPFQLGSGFYHYVLSGTEKGSIKADVVAGWPQRTQIVQDFSGTVEYTDAIIPGTRTWPTHMESTNTIETR